MNNILKQGVVTPFIIFTFPTGFTVEDYSTSPRYFVSLDHTRTCKQACTFKLTIVYAPDTFVEGQPTIIDQQLLSSVGGKVVYTYGYFDKVGKRHCQQGAYTGQIYTYDSDVDIKSGTINYTISGCATAVDLTTSVARIEATNERVKPSSYLKKIINDSTTGGFYDLKTVYDIDINDNIDQEVYIPNFDSAPVLDLIMGTVTAETNDGVPVRKGGIVQLSNGPELPSNCGLLSDMEQQIIHNQGQYTINSDSDARIFKEKYGQAKQRAKAKLKQPFVCYIDDAETGHYKLGTLKYVCNTSRNSTLGLENFIYFIGNNQPQSDVLDFSVSYNGAKGLAAASGTGKTISGIDANGNGIGQTFDVTEVANLGRNSFKSKSGIDQNMLISLKDISQILIYPYEAHMTIMGQLQKNELLDIIYVTVYLNGSKHELLSGDYQIIEISDSIGSSGFTTEFKLIRMDTSNLPVTETAASTPSANDVAEVEAAEMSTINSPTTSQAVQNRT